MKTMKTTKTTLAENSVETRQERKRLFRNFPQVFSFFQTFSLSRGKVKMFVEISICLVVEVKKHHELQ